MLFFLTHKVVENNGHSLTENENCRNNCVNHKEFIKCVGTLVNVGNVCIGGSNVARPGENEECAEALGESACNLCKKTDACVAKTLLALARVIFNFVNAVGNHNVGGDVGVAVIRDRQHLASDGMVLVVCSIDQYDGKLINDPDIISRGFVYMRESEDLINEVKNIIAEIVERYSGENKRKRNELKSVIRSEVGNYLYSKTKRNPMILSVVTET